MLAATKQISLELAVALAMLSCCQQAAGVEGSKGFLHVSGRLSNEANSNGWSSKRGLGATGADHKKTGKAMLRETFDDMLRQALDETGPSMGDVARAVHRKLRLDDAMQQLDGKLPVDVAALVRLTEEKKSAGSGPLDETEIQKARRLLNQMMLDGWAELDGVLFEYKEFQARNRGEYEQVVSDLRGLGSQLARLGGQEISASQGISDANQERKEGEARLEKLSQEFMTTRFENARELAARQNDLAVLNFMLNATSCHGMQGSSLFQVAATPTAARGNESSGGSLPPQVQICRTEDGGIEFNFDSPEMQDKAESMMTPAAKLSLRKALGQLGEAVEAHRLNLLQVSGDSGPTQLRGQAPGMVNRKDKKTPRAHVGTGDNGVKVNASAAVAAAAKGRSLRVPLRLVNSAVHPVVEAPLQGSNHWRKCIDVAEHCGMLRDHMSAQWADLRDGLDGLTQEMAESQASLEAAMKNINDELTVINDQKTKFMELLSGTISSINADTEDMNEKDEQRRSLIRMFDRTSASYNEKISDILFTKICATKRVRNEILSHSALTSPANITDCDFSDWTSKTGECLDAAGQAINCDDGCSGRDPFKCGGHETMKRDIVVLPNAYGMQCPRLERQRSCGQRRCPVDCIVSMWSGWSKCSKDCGGGVQVKTRSVLRKPRSGGLGCDAGQEARPCNTGSCDHDCELEDWSEWSPCSAACGGGMTSRSRPVLVPILGQGRCPKADSGERMEEQRCHTHDCTGDELCVAQQDLVMLVDSSGSLGQGGFGTLRSFATVLSGRYAMRYLGQSAVRLGVGLFGNGRLFSMPDGTTTISPAIGVQGLTDDMLLVRKKIATMQWQRGFTNLAQALALADTMLTENGKQRAQSAILVLSGGKFSFKYQTAEKVQELKDKNIAIFMAPVAEIGGGKELRDLRHWASFPWQTSFQQIPGFGVLKHNEEAFAQKLVTKFCPDSFSPALQRSKDNEKQYMLVRRGGWPNENCAKKLQQSSAGTKDDCAAVARAAKAQAFGFLAEQRSHCLLLKMDGVSREFWNAAASNRTGVACPKGDWEDNELADTYILDPRTI